jgi:predicted TIM-barrel fold metal-dependent hydrolase
MPAGQTGRSGFQVVDADCHVLEPPGDVLAGMMQGDTPPGAIAGGTEVEKVMGGLLRTGIVDRHTQQSDETIATAGDQTGMGHPGGHDPRVRLEVFEEEQITQGVFYPTMLLSHLDDLERSKPLIAGYNDWLSDFCSLDRTRLFGACVVNLTDPDWSERELRRCVGDLDFKAVFLRPCVYIESTQWWDDVYDRFWSVCEELDVAVAFHPFPNDRMPGAGMYFGINSSSSTRAAFMRTPFHPPIDMMYTIDAFIVGGILERHPSLRIGIIEASGGWIVSCLERLDGRYQHLGHTIADDIKMTPSDYFRRQGWISMDAEESGIQYVADYLGADRMMIGSDFPHPDAFYPNFVGNALDRMKDLPDPDKAQILGEAARTFYKLP